MGRAPPIRSSFGKVNRAFLSPCLSLHSGSHEQPGNGLARGGSCSDAKHLFGSGLFCWWSGWDWALSLGGCGRPREAKPAAGFPERERQCLSRQSFFWVLGLRPTLRPRGSRTVPAGRGHVQRPLSAQVSRAETKVRPATMGRANAPRKRASGLGIPTANVIASSLTFAFSALSRGRTHRRRRPAPPAIRLPAPAAEVACPRRAALARPRPRSAPAAPGCRGRIQSTGLRACGCRAGCGG